MAHSVYAKADDMHNGVWVTCFSEKEVLYAIENVDALVKMCRTHGLNQIYIQLYRADQAYYDSQITDASIFQTMKGMAGADPVKYLIEEANRYDIEVHAWINVFSLSRNADCNILRQYGKGVLTRDQHKRSSYRLDEKNESDRFYSRENQYFLEPGDARVNVYSFSIIREVAQKYPDLAGIHLDYIRYPQPVPFVPGSRFNDYGLTYGYGEGNVERFKEITGLDPFKGSGRDFYESWDNWKRKNITQFILQVREYLQAQHPHMQLSCAVIPSVERAYHSAFQDWPGWIKKNIVDYVILMNYTVDSHWFSMVSAMAQSLGSPESVYIGLGAYLVKDPQDLEIQYNQLISQGVKGAVFFSYDSLNEEMLGFLKKENRPSKQKIILL